MKRKYLNDYRLDYELTSSGRLKGVPVYSGQRFHFAMESGQLSKLKWRIAALLAFSVALLVVLLMFTPLLQDAFSLLGIPMGFSLIPLWLMIRAAWLMHTAKMPVTRKTKDQITMQYPGGAWFFMVLSAVTLLGLIAQLIVKPARPAHWLYTADALALTACSILLFSLRKSLVMEPAPETESPEAQAGEES